jgi:exopolyphosphatase / guanosine-5'-triphosphate,3'-diphosphate pyrophosphatase
MASDTRFAVLDLGSTTFQLLVADADTEGSLTPVLRDRVVLNLGRVLAGKGRIPDDVAGRAAETARRLADLSVRMGADHVVPLATSALRDSPDREALASLLGGAVGTDVRFIDGREEARLTFAGVTASVALGQGSTLLLDLGGGSLEVALAGPEGLRWGRSLPIGAGRITGLLVTHDPPTRDERKTVRSAVEEAVAPLVRDVAAAEPARCVASGGTAGALARVLAARRWGFPPGSLNQYEVTVSELRDLTRELATLSLAERLREPGVDERRAELLPAGGWILTSAAGELGAKRLVHSEWGLREGAVLDALGLADRPIPTPDQLGADRSTGWSAHGVRTGGTWIWSPGSPNGCSTTRPGCTVWERSSVRCSVTPRGCTRSVHGSRRPGCTSTAPTSSRTPVYAGSHPTRSR